MCKSAADCGRLQHIRGEFANIISTPNDLSAYNKTALTWLAPLDLRPMASNAGDRFRRELASKLLLLLGIPKACQSLLRWRLTGMRFDLDSIFEKETGGTALLSMIEDPVHRLGTLPTRCTTN